MTLQPLKICSIWLPEVDLARFVLVIAFGEPHQEEANRHDHRFSAATFLPSSQSLTEFLASLSTTDAHFDVERLQSRSQTLSSAQEAQRLPDDELPDKRNSAAPRQRAKPYYTWALLESQRMIYSCTQTPKHPHTHTPTHPHTHTPTHQRMIYSCERLNQQISDFRGETEEYRMEQTPDLVNLFWIHICNVYIYIYIYIYTHELYTHYIHVYMYIYFDMSCFRAGGVHSLQTHMLRIPYT